MIVDYKLTYPSGTATAYLINGFHTPEGSKLAKYIVLVLFSLLFLDIIICGTRRKAMLLNAYIVFFRKQVKTLGKFFLYSFLWGFFQWFYTGGDNCGFQNFPTLGLQAYKNRSEH